MLSDEKIFGKSGSSTDSTNNDSSHNNNNNSIVLSLANQKFFYEAEHQDQKPLFKKDAMAVSLTIEKLFCETKNQYRKVLLNICDRPVFDESACLQGKETASTSPSDKL